MNSSEKITNHRNAPVWAADQGRSGESNVAIRDIDTSVSSLFWTQAIKSAAVRLGVSCSRNRA